MSNQIIDGLENERCQAVSRSNIAYEVHAPTALAVGNMEVAHSTASWKSALQNHIGID